MSEIKSIISPSSIHLPPSEVVAIIVNKILNELKIKYQEATDNG